MALMGRAALAMWWDMAEDRRAEFEHWHSHEHFPERLAIPGFLRAARWRALQGEGFFVQYELADHAVLASEGYLRSLNAPSAWSTKLMPHHRSMVRTQCHVRASCGAALAAELLTLRLAPTADDDAARRAALHALVQRLPRQPGLSGAHLLQHEAPAIATTREQLIRGGDRAADLVLLVCGYDGEALQALVAGELAPWADEAGAVRGRYRLCASATPGDVADITLS
jgi:hypothetical protein